MFYFYINLHWLISTRPIDLWICIIHDFTTKNKMSAAVKYKTRCLLVLQTINANVVQIPLSSVFHSASCAFILEFISCLFSFVSSFLVSGFSLSCYNRYYPHFSHQLLVCHISFKVSKFWNKGIFTSPLHYLCGNIKKKHLNLDEC